MESKQVLKKGELEETADTDKPEAHTIKEPNPKKKKSKKSKNTTDTVPEKPAEQQQAPAENQASEAVQPATHSEAAQDPQLTSEVVADPPQELAEATVADKDPAQPDVAHEGEHIGAAAVEPEPTQAPEPPVTSDPQAVLSPDAQTTVIGNNRDDEDVQHSNQQPITGAATGEASQVERPVVSPDQGLTGDQLSNLTPEAPADHPNPLMTEEGPLGQSVVPSEVRQGAHVDPASLSQAAVSQDDPNTSSVETKNSPPPQVPVVSEPSPADSKPEIVSNPIATEPTIQIEPAGKPEPTSEQKAEGPKQAGSGEDAAKIAPSPKKAKASKATKEDYLAVKGILDKWKQKVTKAETTKKSKLTLLQESLAKTQELQRKLAQETRSREADRAAKEAILAQMETENAAFLKQLDALKKQTPVAAIKETVFKKQVECRKEELTKKLEELKPVQTLFAERLRLQAELGQHHKHQLRLTREIEKHTSLITVLEHKEKEALERLKVSGTDYEAEKARVEATIRQDSEHIASLEAEDLKVVQSIEEATERAKRLENEIQALRREEFECREKFEVDNKFNKDECTRLRAQLQNRELKSEELKQEIATLTQKCEDLSEEITKTVATIKQMHAASKNNVSAANSSIKQDKSQRGALEKLLLEKNELRAEFDRLSREKGKLTVIVKDLGEVRALREANLSLLIEFVASLDHTDRMSVEKEMTTNLNPKSLDIKRLVKSTVGRNIELRYELERLERECLQVGVDCTEH